MWQQMKHLNITYFYLKDFIDRGFLNDVILNRIDPVLQ
jgi:hypothetical protein